MPTLRAYEERMPCNYRLLKDLQDRLDGTICRYEGKAVYVSVKGETRLELYDVQNRRNIIKTISPEDPEFDISATECGYFNFSPNEKAQKSYGLKPGNRVYYLSRNTSKKYKQGTYQSYLQTTLIDGRVNHEMDNTHLLYSDGMVSMIQGEYPSPKDVLEIFSQLGSDTSEYAVSLDIALRKETVGVIFVYYRQQQIGWIAPGTTSIVVTDHELKWVVERHMTRLVWK